MFSLKDRLLAADPGFIRLRTATRATLAVGLATLLLFALRDRFAQPLAAPFVGILTAMMASQTVNDDLLKQRRVTMLLLPLVCATGLLLAVGLAGSRPASLAGFLAVTFGAVATRSLGPRAAAFGMTAFMTYFIVLFFQAPLAAVPAMLAAIVIGTVVSYALRFWLLPDRPQWILRLSLIGFRARQAQLVRSLGAAAAAPATSPRLRNRVLCSLAAVNEAALDLDDSVARWRADGVLPAVGCRLLSTQLFEQELALGRLVGTVSRMIGVARRDPALHALAASAAGAPLAIDPDAAPELDRLAAGFHASGEAGAAAALAEFRQAIRDFHAASPITFPEGAPVADGKSVKAPSPAPPRDWKPPIKLATQATAAVALAAVAGAAISPQTWSWAAFAAFIVFAGTSRGDALKRVTQRLAGTAVGIVMGLGLASLVNGRDAELACIFAGIFVGIHSTRSRYMVATASFTILVAVLYKMLGRLSEGIMLLRLEQTLVGVGCGALAALFIMPVFTGGIAYAAAAKLLRSIGAALTDPGPEKVRAIDRDFQALRAAVSPMIARRTRDGGGRAEGLVHDASALVHYTRLLAASGAPRDAGKQAVYTELGAEACRRADILDAHAQKKRNPHLQQVAMPQSRGAAAPEEHWELRVRQLLDDFTARFDLPSGVLKIADRNAPI